MEYLTRDADFKTVGHGKPPPSELPEARRREVGLAPATLSGLAPGRYDLRCRTIDANGAAQPMPRPLPKAGRNLIQSASFVGEA